MIAPDSGPDHLEERRKRVRESDRVFGLDFVCSCEKKHASEHRLNVHFLGTTPDWLSADQFVLRDSRNQRRLEVQISEETEEIGADGLELVIRGTVEPGVEYELSLLPDENNSRPVIDPFFASVCFEIGPDSEAKSDCLTELSPPVPDASPPEINYLAKDYQSFRQLILDRMSVTMPDWREKSPADMGIMLVEILAYAGDHLSYQQDAVATEAYLGTARFRKSLRRHARLVDYRVHEGCNARAWVHLNVEKEVTVNNASDLFFAAHPNPAGVAIQPEGLEEILTGEPETAVFEPVVSKAFTFHESHNCIRVHDWGGATPCLSAGATTAFFVNQDPKELASPKAAKKTQKTTQESADNDWLHLQVGDVLVLEEVLSPITGCAADADPSNRHPVRITEVEYGHADHVHGTGANDEPLPLIKVTWDAEDALPRTFWISKPASANWNCDEGSEITVARGNMLLVDHGRSIRGEEIELRPSWSEPPADMQAQYPKPSVEGKLGTSDLTFSDRLPNSGASAKAQLDQDPRWATPHAVLQRLSEQENFTEEFSFIELSDIRRLANRLLGRVLTQSAPATTSSSGLRKASEYTSQLCQIFGLGKESEQPSSLLDLTQLLNSLKEDLKGVWLPKYDLLGSDRDDTHFVVEMSNQREAHLRFGRYGFGRAPETSDENGKIEYSADYRIGNGSIGNVASETIQTFGSRRSSLPIRSVRNPMAAAGGIDPESSDQIRLFAPHAARDQLKRAVTEEDYRQLTLQAFAHQFQQARVTFRWTGHEVEALVALDPWDSETISPELIAEVEQFLHPYRRTGHEVRVGAARRVIPQLTLAVKVGKHVIKSQVRDQLNLLFSNGRLPDGSLAFFHPDQLSFGEGVHISRIVSAALQIEGVEDAQVTALHRRDSGPTDELDSGLLRLQPPEIIRFDNDPNRPGFGALELNLTGGRQ